MLLALTLNGCTSTTDFGECIGMFDDRNPQLTYKLSGWNAFISIATMGLIVPPVLWMKNSTFCPTGIKTLPTASQPAIEP